MPSLAEQREHLLFTDTGAGLDAERGQAATCPPSGRLAALGVVGTQPTGGHGAGVVRGHL